MKKTYISPISTSISFHTESQVMTGSNTYGIHETSAEQWSDKKEYNGGLDIWDRSGDKIQ